MSSLTENPEDYYFKSPKFYENHSEYVNNLHLNALGDTKGNYDIRFFHAGELKLSPLDFKQFRENAISRFDEDVFAEPEKMIMVGNQLSSDIVFGNKNNMCTVWINGFKDTCEAVKD